MSIEHVFFSVFLEKDDEMGQKPYKTPAVSVKPALDVTGSEGIHQRGCAKKPGPESSGGRRWVWCQKDGPGTTKTAGF